MNLKPGSRWRSAVSSAEVVVVRPPKTAVALESGGHPMVLFGADRPEGLTPAADRAEVLKMGKRYADADTGLELLVSKAGEGTLSVDGRELALKDAKALPSSD